MNLAELTQDRQAEAIAVITRSFGDSEGEAEGELIGKLAGDMLRTTNDDDICGFYAEDGEEMVGCILFSRFTLPVDKSAFILSPVAIVTARQGQGIGQALINHGIDVLQSRGVELVFTYGDPAYYQQVGFQPITEDVVRAPQPMSLPHGWQGQSLTADELRPIEGLTRCVDALNKPEYW